jgi:hypothetical protein
MEVTMINHEELNRVRAMTIGDLLDMLEGDVADDGNMERTAATPTSHKTRVLLI